MQAEPGEPYIGPATFAKSPVTFLEECFKAGLLEYWSAVSVHPYRHGNPETVAPTTPGIAQTDRPLRPEGQRPSRLSRANGDTRPPGSTSDEAEQGKMLPREWLTNLANGVPLSIWYDWHDDGRDPNEPEHHFGTVASPVPGRQNARLRAQARVPGGPDAFPAAGGLSFPASG